MGERESHIRQLCDELVFRCHLETSSHPWFAPNTGVHGHAYTDSIHVYSWREDSLIPYYAALHEIGHVFMRHIASGNYYSQMLDCEAEAWEFALVFANEPMDDAVRDRIKTHWFGSYVRDKSLTATAGTTFNRMAKELL